MFRFALAGTVLALLLAAAAQTAFVDGLYYWGAEVNSFHPCGSDSAYWVVTDSATQQQLIAIVDSLTDRPYQPVLARVEGKRVDGTRDGFAADYDGLFEIRRLVWVRRAPGDSCP